MDTIVIGAGPAGSRTAGLLAKQGFSVLLLEKRERIGYPVRCAEAIGPKRDVERFVTLDDSIVSATINGITIVAPDGRTFEAEMPGIGFTVDRERFDRRLAETASEAGATLRTGHQAMDLVRENGRVCGVVVREIATGNEYRVTGRVVVGADGIESLSPRWAGIKKAFRPHEVLSCAQELIEGDNLPVDRLEFHLGSRHAPGGYAWVFPKGHGKANVGIGINGLMTGGKTALEYLDGFIAHRCPTGSRTRLVVGGCEVARGLDRLVADGFVAVGEAASQNNPFSGGGVMNALEAADMAAKAIADAIRSDSVSAGALACYEQACARSFGRSNALFFKAAAIFFKLSDKDMSRVIERIIRTPGIIDRSGIDPKKMLKALVKMHPWLLWRVVRTLIGA